MADLFFKVTTPKPRLAGVQAFATLELADSTPLIAALIDLLKDSKLVLGTVLPTLGLFLDAFAGLAQLGLGDGVPFWLKSRPQKVSLDP